MKSADRTATMNAIQGGVLDHLAEAAQQGETKFSGKQFGNAIDKIGAGKLQAILGSDGYARLDSLRKAAAAATIEPDWVQPNRSNTALMLLGLVRGARAIPVAGHGITDAMEKIMEGEAQVKALSGVKAASSTPQNTGVSEAIKKALALSLRRVAPVAAGTVINQSRSTGAAPGG